MRPFNVISWKRRVHRSPSTKTSDVTVWLLMCAFWNTCCNLWKVFTSELKCKRGLLHLLLFPWIGSQFLLEQLLKWVLMMENMTIKRELPLRDDQSRMNQPEVHKVGTAMVMGRALVIPPHTATSARSFHVKVVPDISCFVFLFLLVL